MQEKQTEAGNSIAITVIADVTDPKLIWLKAEPILPLYQFNKNPNAEAWFRLTTITDKQINPVFNYHLPKAAEAEQFNNYGDEQFRKKNILAFYEKIKSSIDTFYKMFDTTASLSHSECFATIATELTKLQNLPARMKLLIVYSDLLERSVFDAYEHIENATPQEIAGILLKQHSIPATLKEIEVIVVYQPSTRKEDQQVVKMLSAYKNIIESRGGLLKVQASQSF